MLIVNQDGTKRFNYNNVESISIEKEQKCLYLTTVSGENYCIGKFETEENAEACLVALDEAIIEQEVSNLLKVSSVDELADIYEDTYIFYVAENSNLELK